MTQTQKVEYSSTLTLKDKWMRSQNVTPKNDDIYQLKKKVGRVKSSIEITPTTCYLQKRLSRDQFSSTTQIEPKFIQAPMTSSHSSIAMDHYNSTTNLSTRAKRATLISPSSSNKENQPYQCKNLGNMV